jgi:hypothetical protein
VLVLVGTATALSAPARKLRAIVRPEMASSLMRNSVVDPAMPTSANGAWLLMPALTPLVDRLNPERTDDCDTGAPLRYIVAVPPVKVAAM